MEVISIDARDATLAAEGMKVEPMKEVVDETWIVTVKVTDVERRIQRPKRLRNEEYLANGAVSSCHDAWRIDD